MEKEQKRKHRNPLYSCIPELCNRVPSLPCILARVVRNQEANFLGRSEQQLMRTYPNAGLRCFEQFEQSLNVDLDSCQKPEILKQQRLALEAKRDAVA